MYDRKLRITNNKVWMLHLRRLFQYFIKFDETTDKLTIIDETVSENKRNASVAISNSDKKIQTLDGRNVYY